MVVRRGRARCGWLDVDVDADVDVDVGGHGRGLAVHPSGDRIIPEGVFVLGNLIQGEVFSLRPQRG